MASNIVLEGVAEALATLDPRVVTTAARISINKVARSGRTAASEQIRTLWNIKKGELDSRIEVVDMRVSGPGAYLTFGGRGISTAYFDAVQFAANVKRRMIKDRKTKAVMVKESKRKKDYVLQGVRTTVRLGQPKALPHAFLARMGNGHLAVASRIVGSQMKGKKKEKIRDQAVVSVATMFKQPRVFAAFLNKVYLQWGTVFPHELEQAQKRLDARS